MSAVHQGRVDLREAFPLASVTTTMYDREFVKRSQRERDARERQARIVSTRVDLRFGPDSDIHRMLGLTGTDATPDGLGATRLREHNYARRARKAEHA